MTDQQNPPEPDYTAMQPGHMLDALRDDASLWAKAFCQHARNLGQEIDEGWMIGWFANAIETSWAHRVRRAEPETRPVIDPEAFP